MTNQSPARDRLAALLALADLLVDDAQGGAGGVEPLTSAFTGPRATATPHAA